MGRFFNFLVYSSIFFLNFVPVKDPDFGWHYQCGSNLLSGKPCLTNTFSYFLPNYQAFNPSFVFDTITALTFNSIGFIGVSILYASLMTAVFYLFYHLSKQHILIAAVAFAIIIFLSNGTLDLGWRSQIVTYGFYVFGLYILSRRKIRTYSVLMLIWVNSHIGFFTGIILYSFYFLDQSIRVIIDNKYKKEWVVTVAIGATSIIATFINPFGWKVYREIFNHLSSPLNTMIAEWVGPPITHIILIIIISIILPITQTIKRKFTLFQFLNLIFFGILAIMARRNLPIFYTIAAIQILILLPKSRTDKNYLFLIFPVISAIFISVAIIHINLTSKFYNDWSTYCTEGAARYPCAALKVYPQISGNVYAAYEWGGFLIWQRPDIKVFSDGRMPAWRDENGESPYNVYLHILQTRPGWNETLRKYKTDYLLLAQGTFLDLLLDTEAEEYDWEKVYEDKTHAIYKNLKAY
ncbi:hypothetical protein COV58_00470 [Candidatus Roizmanbacteria bacterium CG11_big_fil_rev_8_21_14_0_20_36_8]|uniref:Glycosyltransferase RgtA/B/C/D-like domain-containing protein n=2 Tax=Candidatus Roizmaniibacteriota TaxID=1752723 RepID=A0A2M6IV90_9BACT|nr:MAG: hypothetical protein COV58_00470 [Candidatus Roizmanbacteria bacterium CG11_big_fil_rev_8_21_14_0_20_36_8]PIZ65267.1 MAG: hypothetical protein COY14_02795 [Candidatus Roizmanbacteria bacterium CG_4_10_14_0_2_um_filter_36_9]